MNQNTSPGTSILTTTNTLIPGNRYNIMIDGFDANICDYSIRATSGVQAINITANPDGTICQGSSSILSVQNAPPGTTFSWQPANQISGPTNTPSITATPTTTTIYSVTAEIPGLCGTQSVSKTITVSPLPEVNIQGDTIICNNQGPVTLTASSNSLNPIPVSFSASPNVTIPDNNATGITSTIKVSGLNGNVNNQLLSVCINITHNFVSDLQVELRCSNSTVISLVNRAGDAGRNYNNTCFTPDATVPIPPPTPRQMHPSRATDSLLILSLISITVLSTETGVLL